MQRLRAPRPLLALAVGATLLIGSNATAQGPLFHDVPAGHWAKNAVERSTRLGLMVGFPDNSFQGELPIDRFEMSLILSRLIDLVNQAFLNERANEQDASLAAEQLAAIEETIAELEAALDEWERFAAARFSAYDTRLNTLSVQVENLVAALESGMLVGPAGPKVQLVPRGLPGRKARKANAAPWVHAARAAKTASSRMRPPPRRPAASPSSTPATNGSLSPKNRPNPNRPDLTRP